MVPEPPTQNAKPQLGSTELLQLLLEASAPATAQQEPAICGADAISVQGTSPGKGVGTSTDGSNNDLDLSDITGLLSEVCASGIWKSVMNIVLWKT